MPDQLRTVPEVAAVLALSKESVGRLIKAGALPSVKVGGARRIRQSDLDAFIAGRPHDDMEVTT